MADFSLAPKSGEIIEEVRFVVDSVSGSLGDLSVIFKAQRKGWMFWKTVAKVRWEDEEAERFPDMPTVAEFLASQNRP